jgi:hypothetical protein
MQRAETDEEYSAAHLVLHTALGLHPGEWPVVAYPDEEKSAHPAGTAAALWFPRARKLHAELVAALDAEE